MIGVPLSFSQGSEDPSYLFSENAYYIEDLYARYLKDPNAVPEAWRDYFTTIQDGIPDAREAAAMRTTTAPAAAPKTSAPSPAVDALKQTAALRLITVYRVRGHQQADVDPLRLRPRPPVPDLDPAFHNLSEADMDTAFHTGALELGLRGQKAGSRALAAIGQLPLRKIIELARQIYCGSIGSEYMHITDTTQKRWIQDWSNNWASHSLQPKSAGRSCNG
jgi:2-oxoglutarate dehydrogenase E1 component